MAEKRNEKMQEDQRRIAEEYYQSSYYNGKSQFEKGLATTHEQVSDTYAEGTIDQQEE
mgnify:CR=1 FL=1